MFELFSLVECFIKEFIMDWEIYFILALILQA